MRTAALFLAGALVGGVAGASVVAVRQEGAAPVGLAPSSAPATLAPVPSASAAPLAPGSVEEVAKQLGPSVVTVVNNVRSGQPQSSGSGFLVDSQKGYVLTNSHVVSNVTGSGVGASFDVIFADNRKVSAKLVGRDVETDVAILQVPPQQVRALTLGDSDAAPIGATVIAIGSALGEFRNSVTVGVLSGKGRRLPSEARPDVFLEDLIQTDAAISPGNSGGPLILASTQQVIGMNTLVVREAGSEGLGFAISSNTVRRIADEILRNGRVERGFIGIRYVLLSPRNAQALGLPAGASGAQISEVLPGTPAAAAGLRRGDVITRVNDQVIDEDHPLATVMLRYRAGDRVTLTLIRNGSEEKVEVTLGSSS